MMGDLAFVYRWPPAVMDAMSLQELAGWHAGAVERYNQANRTEQ